MHQKWASPSCDSIWLGMTMWIIQDVCCTLLSVQTQGIMSQPFKWREMFGSLLFCKHVVGDDFKGRWFGERLFFFLLHRSVSGMLQATWRPPCPWRDSPQQISSHLCWLGGWFWLSSTITLSRQACSIQHSYHECAGTLWVKRTCVCKQVRIEASPFHCYNGCRLHSRKCAWGR